MAFLTAGIAGLGLALVVIGLAGRLRAPASAVEERMQYYALAGSAEADPLQGSFLDRVLGPSLRRLHQAVMRWTPRRYQERMRVALELSGYPLGLSLVNYVVARLTVAVAGLTIGLGVGVLANSALDAVLLAPLLAATAWIAVGVWLDQMRRARQHDVLVTLPEVIDFVVIAVEAGLNFEIALARVVEKFRSPLTDGLGQALAEVRLGRSREEALLGFARRTGVDEVSRFIRAVLNAEQLGVPLANALRAQADDLRWRRRERAKEKGAQAPLKMTVPMVVFIFPTIWLVLVGPGLLRILTHGL